MSILEKFWYVYGQKMFQEKIREAVRYLTKALQEFKNPVITCSYGKDSILTLWLTRTIKKDVPVIFVNTGFELPDLYKFRKKIKEEWGIKEIVLPPKHSFWWIVGRHGFPILSKGTTWRYDRRYLPAHYCCLYLKKRPLSQYLRKSDFDLVIDGLRKDESQLRNYSINKYGVLHYHKGNRRFRLHPIANITDEEMEEIYRRFKIPYCETYDKKVEGLINRTGCWCCTLNLKYPKVKFLRLYYPKLWKVLLDKGLDKIIAEKKLGCEVTKDFVEHLQKTRPCYFDTL